MQQCQQYNKHNVKREKNNSPRTISVWLSKTKHTVGHTYIHNKTVFKEAKEWYTPNQNSSYRG